MHPPRRRARLAGEVDAICTAPLNKEALHAGGHVYPGPHRAARPAHRHAGGVDDARAPRVRVIHVTTHIGLIDAVARIEPGLVERTIRRGHEALRRRRRRRTRGSRVCGINPHAGENGLFGHGEEAEKIDPGHRRAAAPTASTRRARCRPTPLFFLAGRGDFDLVVAMYHDQGHGPVKVLGLEAGVNMTVGLPVIRTSVDHGTAFDIAGTGIADERSMLEALRQAAVLAPKPDPDAPGTHPGVRPWCVPGSGGGERSGHRHDGDGEHHGHSHLVEPLGDRVGIEPGGSANCE